MSFKANKKQKKNKKKQVACVNRSINSKLFLNFTYGTHSINLDSAHWPMGFKMSCYLVKEINRVEMRN